MARLRTFIAVDLGKAVRDRAVALQQQIARTGAVVKWVEPANIHLTLLFLGEVDSREVPGVCKIAAECAGRHPAFGLSVEGVGCFPNARRPRVVWVGIGAGAQPLCTIHDELEVPLEELGYRREERRYTPHVTLGRVTGDRPTDGLATALAAQAAWKGGETTVRELRVMSSHLTPNGPVYTVLSKSQLD
jgi:2'-5' RNA ligase